MNNKSKIINNDKKLGFHKNNPHQGRYDFAKLTQVMPELAKVTKLNPTGEPTIDFSDSKAVLILNRALLKSYYGVGFWGIPEGYLCPPIPGRADYIHHLADLLTNHSQTSDSIIGYENFSEDQTINTNSSDTKTTKKFTSKKTTPKGKLINILDIGTGANCIYPIIGSQSYGWKFTATDIDPVAINTAQAIVQSNKNLANNIITKLQTKPNTMFGDIIKKDHYYDATMCNPPFHASLEDANNANINKQVKLARHKANRSHSAHTPKVTDQTNLNFGGQNSELCCDGGEIAFLKLMIKESQSYAEQVGWFTSLISKKENIKPLNFLLQHLNAREVKVIDMQHGQKTTRILAWRF